MRAAIPPLPQYFFNPLCLVKNRDNFTFTLTSNLEAVKYELILYLLSSRTVDKCGR